MLQMIGFIQIVIGQDSDVLRLGCSHARPEVAYYADVLRPALVANTWIAKRRDRCACYRLSGCL